VIGAVTAARRALRIALAERGAPTDRTSLQELSGYSAVPIVRASIYWLGEHRELSFAASETELCVPWLADVVAGTRFFTSVLPVAECACGRWGRARYRWTVQAEHLARLVEDSRQGGAERDGAA
jgi:hypothetical protein